MYDLKAFLRMIQSSEYFEILLIFGKEKKTTPIGVYAFWCLIAQRHTNPKTIVCVLKLKVQ